MALNDSEWFNICRLVIDNMEREVNIIREAGSSWTLDSSENVQLTIEAEKEIEGVNRLGKRILHDIRQIPMEV